MAAQIVTISGPHRSILSGGLQQNQLLSSRSWAKSAGFGAHLCFAGLPRLTYRYGAGSTVSICRCPQRQPLLSLENCAMAEAASLQWLPSAAYLYVLHLDGPALAWEYLWRNPDYRRDWLLRRRPPDSAQRWGLRLLEDPDLDAREAHPAWFPDHETVVQLYPHADPPRDALPFEFWSIPGHKQLVHDGRRLVLIVRLPGCLLRIALAPALSDGMAYAHALQVSRSPCRTRALAGALYQFTATRAEPVAATKPRPSQSMLMELHTLQALDGFLTGAPLREVAEALYGPNAVATWHTDGDLRARVRRLVQRGQKLMRDGYCRLAQIPPLEKGRFELHPKRPSPRL